MENLAQIETVRHKIKTGSVAAVKALHKFIFQVDGDRQNRKRLREFKGFNFREGSAEYAEKLTHANGLTYGDMVSCCNILGLDYQGSKNDLIKRVCDGLMDINSLAEIQDDENDALEDEDEERNDVVNERGSMHDNDNDGEDVRLNAENQRAVRFTMHYRDVEDSIRSFDGSDSYPVERWIAEFEDTATLYNWTEMEKVIFAKKSLKGFAKLYIQSEGVIKTWKKLKD